MTITFNSNLDIQGLLQDRITYIRRFYTSVVSPFEIQKRKIDMGEEPFVDRRNPEDCDGPPFEFAWRDAHEDQRMIGFLCLLLLNKAVEDYCRLFVVRELKAVTGKDFNSGLNSAFETLGISKTQLRGMGAIRKFLLYAQNMTPFAWSECPVTEADIEDITLTRNIFAHHPDLDDMLLRQEKSVRPGMHSAFADLRWISLDWKDQAFTPPLYVTRDNLLPALTKVSELCAYLETCRTR